MPTEMRDTGPLDPSLLSDDELRTFLAIETRLREVRDTAKANDQQQHDYLHRAEDRSPHVFLLDGARGTGKTSLLLTLVRRWNPPSKPGKEGKEAREELNEQYRTRLGRVDELQSDQLKYAQCPEFIRALRILDFDPLPPGMPLVAGIVQDWRPLADRCAAIARGAAQSPLSWPGTTEPDEGTPLDKWYRLFRMAASGWAPIPQEGGIIQQVLEREDQVGDWLALPRAWQDFVNSVVEFGRAHPERFDWSEQPVFVIIIDDVDLQVERARELLPALRMLYHPSVAFLVAADQQHLIDMLKIEFMGQQNRVANLQLARDALAESDRDRWAGVLADASFEKVFPRVNRWRIRKLSLPELLAFPAANESTIQHLLDGWAQQANPRRKIGPLGVYLREMTKNAVELAELGAITTYRTIHQIFHKAQEQKDEASRAAEAIRLILSGSGADELVRIPAPRAPGNGAQRIDYLATGELIALYHEVHSVEIGNEGRVVLSAHPRLIRVDGRDRESIRTTAGAEHHAKLTSAIIAASMRDDGYGLLAPGLQWNVRLALVWTAVRIFEGVDESIDLAFRWQLYEHPSPLRLLQWTNDWRDFVNEWDQHLHEPNTERELERIAYAWVYYQLLWSSANPDRLRGTLKSPLSEKLTDNAWSELLSREPEVGKDEEERKSWRRRILPLMARPELGLPPGVQERFLKGVQGPSDLEWLKDQRRRRITDAIVAAASHADVEPKDPEKQETVDRCVAQLEQRHKDAHEAPSPWQEHVQVPAGKTQSERRSRGSGTA